MLNNIFYYRKKQNYEINIDTNNIIELNYDTKFIIDFKNDCSKNAVIKNKFSTLYDSKRIDDLCYFSFIKSFSLLNYCLENQDYDKLFYVIDGLDNKLIISDNEKDKKLNASILLKNLHLLYLYFANYPYIYGVLNDEEINEVLSQFNPDMTEIDLKVILVCGYNLLIDNVGTLAFKVEKGKSILNEKETLKSLQKALIKINFSYEQLIEGYNISELSKYYQIKNYVRDIDFCLGKAILAIINNACKNYPFGLKTDILRSFMNKEKRFIFYKLYDVQSKRLNENNIENDQIKTYNKSIKYNDTIVLGDKEFHNIIKKMNLPCKNIYELNKKEFSNFFYNPKKIKGKYNICKYFIIMNEQNGNEYIETIRYISNVFGLKFVVIIYIQNKDVKINKKILQNPFIPVILTYCEKDILNFYDETIID